MWMALSRLDRIDGASAAMLRAEESRTIAQGSLSAVVNIETATRGFVLYADPALLTPFENAAPAARSAARSPARRPQSGSRDFERSTAARAEHLAVGTHHRAQARRHRQTANRRIQRSAMATTKSIRLLADEIDTAETERLTNARSSVESRTPEHATDRNRDVRNDARRHRAGGMGPGTVAATRADPPGGFRNRSDDEPTLPEP